MATLPASIERNSKLYTLARDPLTKKGKGGVQTPTRPMVGWMEAVNQSLLDLLFESVVGISDSDITQQGNVNNFALLGADVIRFTNTVNLTLTGIVPTRTSQQVILLAVGTGRVDVANASTLSEAANQVLTGVRDTISLAPGAGYARLYYDGTDAQWRVITHEQGAALTPPFLATDYTSDTGSWTVTADQVKTFGTYLNGSLLYVTLRLLSTVPVGNPTKLFINLPFGYSAKKHITGVVFLRSGVALLGEPGLLQVEPSGRVMIIEKFNLVDVPEGFKFQVDILGQFNMEIGSAGTDIDPDGGPVPVSGGGPGGPGGGGGGSGPGGIVPTSPLPDESATIVTLAEANPVALAESCQETGGNSVFLDLVVSTLQAGDIRWGYNGKRGDVNDLSIDAISYYWGAGAPVDGANEVYVVDFIGAVCGGGANPSPQFEDVTDYSGAVLGAYVGSS